MLRKKKFDKNLFNNFKKTSLKRGDKVKVISGDYKGKISNIIDIDKKNGRVKVSEVNLQTNFIKNNSQKNSEGIVKKEGWIHISNVSLLKGDSNEI